MREERRSAKRRARRDAMDLDENEGIGAGEPGPARGHVLRAGRRPFGLTSSRASGRRSRT